MSSIRKTNYNRNIDREFNTGFSYMCVGELKEQSGNTEITQKQLQRAVDYL
jgi:hypothetical protein